MRGTLLAVLCTTGCITGTLSPGVLREDWSEPRRDPDPTADPTREITENPWAEETAPADPDTAARREQAERAIATVLAAVAAGWTPLLVYHGTFEETPGVRVTPRTRPSP